MEKYMLVIILNSEYHIRKQYVYGQMIRGIKVKQQKKSR